MKYLKMFEVNAYSRIETSKLEILLQKIGFKNPKVRPTTLEDFYISVQFYNYKGPSWIILDKITKLSFLKERSISTNTVFFRLENKDFEDFIKILKIGTLEEIEVYLDANKYNL